jgi:hypothetical protein
MKNIKEILTENRESVQEMNKPTGYKAQAHFQNSGKQLNGK